MSAGNSSSLLAAGVFLTHSPLQSPLAVQGLLSLTLEGLGLKQLQHGSVSRVGLRIGQAEHSWPPRWSSLGSLSMGEGELAVVSTAYC